MMEGDYLNVHKYLSTASLLMKNGKIEVRPWNSKEYLKKMFSEIKYHKVELKTSGKSTRNSMSFWVYFKMEDIKHNVEFDGNEILRVEFDNKDHIHSIDRIFNSDDKRKELFPEIDFNFDVEIEWIADTKSNHHLIY